MSYSVKILADSLNVATGDRLTTMECTYPRMVHSEFMTHRQFSRNSASSRAIPVEKMIQRVLENPVIPVYWGKNQKGMQAGEEVGDDLKQSAKHYWLAARDEAVKRARHFTTIGIHKQIVNRLLEPWMWITVIVSATEWENFFALRCHKDAQPEIQKLAYMMRAALEGSAPDFIEPGTWHLPMFDEEDEKWVAENVSVTKEPTFVRFDPYPRISAARCARVSYLTHDGVRNPAADLELCDKLVEPGHFSPLEHPAVAVEKSSRFLGNGNFVGFRQFRKFFPTEHRGRDLEEP